jgi:hypothetical protein
MADFMRLMNVDFWPEVSETRPIETQCHLLAVLPAFGARSGRISEFAIFD